MSSLEGIAPEDQVLLLAGTPLEDEATLGQCGVEALTTLEVAGRMLGGELGRIVRSLNCLEGPNGYSNQCPQSMVVLSVNLRIVTLQRSLED